MNEFFCTHGRGLQSFVLHELELLNKNDTVCEMVDSIEGKILFRTNVTLPKLLILLKIVERLFLKIIFVKFNSQDNDKPQADTKYAENLVEKSFHLNTNSILFNQILDNLQGNTKEETSSNEKSESDSKKICKSIKFRVNLKTTGKWKLMEKNQKLKESLIQLITNKILHSNSHFDIDLKEPHFEIACHLSDTCLACGLAVSKRSLSLRSKIKHVGLRSTICSSMLQLSELNISPDMLIVLDPFCGKSTIFTEYFSCQCEIGDDKSKAFYIGSDSEAEQLQFSSENLSFGMNSEKLYDLVLAKMNRTSPFPYRDNCIDMIISDLPFGIKHLRNMAILGNTDVFYEIVLIEFNRLLVRENGVMVLLINANETKNFEVIFNRLSSENIPFPRIAQKNVVSLGETHACIYKLIN